MHKFMTGLWQDDCGALIATEWVFVATLLIIGCVTGLTAIRNSVNQQLEEVSGAILSLDTSYDLSGQKNAESRTAGASHIDNRIDVQIIDGKPVRTLPGVPGDAGKLVPADAHPCD